MLFNTLDFALFLAVVLVFYHALSRRWQNLFLLGASYFFYASWDWRFLGLLVLSTLVDFVVGARIASTDLPRRRRALLTLSLGVNLGVLGFFKYFDFFAEGFADLLATLGFEASPFVLGVVLPVGISFYTFQTLSYTIDIYRGQLEPTKSPIDFALFVSFFPQLVAGPIERAKRLLPQIEGEREVTWAAARTGAWLILWGTFKKVYIADNVGHLADAVFDPSSEPTSLELLLGTYAFAVQLYCDFSGYTDVARGAARLLGFDLMVNFRLPYFATNPRELWRRWHISLSTWLRDYVFIPLGGSRGTSAFVYRNLLLTMLIGGLWHGAAWTFVIWGALHGAFLAIHRALEPQLRRFAPTQGLGRLAWMGAGIVVTFHLWSFALIFFRATSLDQSLELVRTLFSSPELGLAAEWLPVFFLFVTPLILMQVWQGIRDRLDVVPRAHFVVRTAVYALLIIGLLLFGEDHGQPFLYFQF